ncbi:TlpA family protein disulfide reductase [Mucilaginibacter mali]|uniref:TlpA family protein disulfide reductase n=1 Tax=Mucilaginibacter mali TaxID=2740462 RepID=A0A7D4Q2F5_9SPHI|nr:TlpA disulfide reductase family protein [Mucilaginibacter mali]QKJ29627.1 TlpA family protein disulfide reductase [Mucilaginibacter mali]
MRTAFTISIISILLIAGLNTCAQDRMPGTALSLKGETATTVFKNATKDTLKIRGMLFNWLPYNENNFSLNIAPGAKDSVTLPFNYPDLIYINDNFRVLNAPGKRVICTIRSIKPKATDADFDGDLKIENTYYLSYSNFLGNPDQESRAFYTIGEKLTDFNLFPAIADSITNVRLSFLERYNQLLAPWFKKYEYARLVHNGMMRKDNVLISKRFYGGKPIPVNDHYYDFEKSLNLADTTQLLSTEYLWAADNVIYHQAQRSKKPMPQVLLYAMDSLAGNTVLTDVFKTRKLGMLYTNKREDYNTNLALMKFTTADTKAMVDSMIQARLGYPKLGKKAPEMVLKDIDGNTVSLSSFGGRPVIVNFWAEWCGPCKAEFPFENKLYQRYKDKGLVVINVCVETDAEHWKIITKRDNLQMVNLFANAEVYKKIKAAYNIGALPRSILITKEHKVADNYYQRASRLTDKDVAALLNN